MRRGLPTGGLDVEAGITTMDDDTRLVGIDGRDALFGLVIRPRAGDPGGVTVETWGSGLYRRMAAAYLYRVADALDAAGADDGEPAVSVPRDRGGHAPS